MIGAGICTTTTLNEQMLVPQAFVAEQVTVLVPMAKLLPLGGEHAKRPPPVTTGLGKSTTALLLHVVAKMVDGQVMLTAGICVTTTLIEHCVFPQALVAMQSTVLVPRLKLLPLGGTQLSNPPPVTTGLAKVTIALVPQVVTLMFEGHEIEGAVKPATVTTCVQVVELPQPSVASQT